MFGAEYISQHVRQAYEREQKSARWQAYVAETLRCISESCTKMGGGPYMKAHWWEIADPKSQKHREPGEIAAEVIKGAGLVVAGRKEADRGGV